jgi:FixJ family two-component response regulator
MHIPLDACGNITWRGADGTIDDIGALTASIAHEVSQPLSDIVNDDTTWRLIRPTSGSCSEQPSSARPLTPIVFVVADDEYMRRSVGQLITTTGFDVERCGSAEEFLSLSRPAVPCCLLGVSLSSANGLELQRQVGARMDMPIVFITDRPDVRVAVQAMKAGAVDVLANPVNPELLLSAVDAAIARSRAALHRDAALQPVRDCYASLTPRESEVMGLVVSGLLNRQVAFELGISEITVKAHRGQVMRKMKADSLAHLVRMAASLDAARLHRTTEFM